jgi:hypothetical protein
MGQVAVAGGDLTVRLYARDLPVLAVLGILGFAVGYTVLVDLEVLSAERQWGPQWIVFLTVLVLPLVAIWNAAPPGEPSTLWLFVAPLVGAYLVAHYYAFDVYDGPPYARNSMASDMPALAIYAGAAVALAIGYLTWYRRRIGVALTVAVCLGCAVLVFFSNVFH